MPEEYSGAWEHLNSELSRIELPDGWLILSRTHIIVGGKDIWVVNNAKIYHDPEKKWRIKSKQV